MKLQITIEGRAYAVDVELLEEVAPLVEEEPYTPLHAMQPQSFAQNAIDGDPNVCRSPVTGLVIKVNVEPGQVVEAGAQLMVLEAMKMETAITTPYAAIVKAAHVKPGDAVKTGQVLMEFDNESMKGPERATDE